MNIVEVVNNGLCRQCGTCITACPNRAVKYSWDYKNGYKINVDSDKCTDCGVCYEVCPGREVNFLRLEEEFLDGDHSSPLIGCYQKCCSGWTNNARDRWLASSGGMVTALLVSALKKNLIDGCIVALTNPDEPTMFVPHLARTENEIIKATGSRYLPVLKNSILKDIPEDIKRLALVGLPCHIHGLRKLQRRYALYKEKITVTLGLFCGNNFAPMATILTLKEHGVQTDRIAFLKHRGKGWPGNLCIRYKDGREVTLPYPAYAGDHFRKNVLPGCKVCADGTSELADISFGDAWLDKHRKIDELGTSLVIVRSLTGSKFLQKAGEGVVINEISAEKVIKSQKKMLDSKKIYLQIHLKMLRLTKRSVPTYLLRSVKVKLPDYFDLMLICIRTYKHVFYTWIKRHRKVFRFVNAIRDFINIW